MSDDEEPLGIAIEKLLFIREPGLLVCDLEATARCLSALSQLIGCLMSTALVREPENYDGILESVMDVINRSAFQTLDRVSKIKEAQEGERKVH